MNELAHQVLCLEGVYRGRRLTDSRQKGCCTMEDVSQSREESDWWEWD